MHIIIGIISALAGLFWALNALSRSGFSFTSLNPFLWNRRRKWKQLYAEKPIYNLDSPMEVAAVLVLGIVKCEGAITTDQKNQLSRLFESEFKLDQQQAADLMLASNHLIRDELYLADNIDKILDKSQSNFKPQQIKSMLDLMQTASQIEGPSNDEQQQLIQATSHYFSKMKPAEW